MATRRTARITGANRHPIGREIGEARAKARIDIFVENLGGRLDMRIGVEYAQPVLHPALPTLFRILYTRRTPPETGALLAVTVLPTPSLDMRRGHAAPARENTRP